MEEHGDNRVKMGLLLFWGCHPNAKFASNAICYALDCTKLEMDRGLKALVEAGLVDTHILNGVTFYSLTSNDERRRPVLDLAALNWDRWRLMLNRLEQKHKVVKAST
jgi:hypothetical protein